MYVAEIGWPIRFRICTIASRFEDTVINPPGAGFGYTNKLKLPSGPDPGPEEIAEFFSIRTPPFIDPTRRENLFSTYKLLKEIKNATSKPTSRSVKVYFKEDEWPKEKLNLEATYHFLLKYSSQIKEVKFAEKLAKWLEEQGFVPWLDKKGGIIAGDPFDVRIENGISECGLVIALLSPSSIRHGSFCRNEWLYAQSIAKPIIPLRLTNLTPTLVIINLHYEDAFPDPDQVFSVLLPVINEVVSQGKSLYREWGNKSGNLSIDEISKFS